jgi:hypothetical protein
MTLQPRLSDFDEKALLAPSKKLYPQYVAILQRLSRLEPLSEIKCLERLSKQALHDQVKRLVGKGWVERRDFGVYEVTKEGLNYLKSISGRSKASQSDGGLPVKSSKVFDWLSVHFFKVRFNLKGERFSKEGLQKNARNRWVEYFDDPPTTLEVRKRCLTVTVHGLKGSNATVLASKGLSVARDCVLAFCARRGARVFECGEFMGMPHWVVEELNTSAGLRALLGLRAGAPSVRLAGLEWYVDRSHGDLVEARGELDTAKVVFNNFGYLLSGALARDIQTIKSELGGVKDVAREVALLREDLCYKPRGGVRREVV